MLLSILNYRFGARSVKKRCFYNFRAVFGDFGQNVPLPRDPVRETLLRRTNVFHWQFSKYSLNLSLDKVLVL